MEDKGGFDFGIWKTLNHFTFTFQLFQGPDSEEFAAASKLEDDVNFYQTTNPNVAKMFKLEVGDARPSLVLLKKEDEKVTYFG